MRAPRCRWAWCSQGNPRLVVDWARKPHVRREVVGATYRDPNSGTGHIDAVHQPWCPNPRSADSCWSTGRSWMRSVRDDLAVVRDDQALTLPGQKLQALPQCLLAVGERHGVGGKMRGTAHGFGLPSVRFWRPGRVWGSGGAAGRAGEGRVRHRVRRPDCGGGGAAARTSSAASSTVATSSWPTEANAGCPVTDRRTVGDHGTAPSATMGPRQRRRASTKPWAASVGLPLSARPWPLPGEYTRSRGRICTLKVLGGRQPQDRRARVVGSLPRCAGPSGFPRLARSPVRCLPLVCRGSV